MIVAALALLVVGGALFVVRLLLGPTLADRIVAVDGLIVTIVAAIVLHSIQAETTAFLDVAVVVAFIGFVATIAAARFIERRGA